MESEFRNIISNRLIARRTELNFSQEKLANIANLDRSYISRIERGLISPTIESLHKICLALGISLQLFLKEL